MTTEQKVFSWVALVAEYLVILSITLFVPGTMKWVWFSVFVAVSVVTWLLDLRGITELWKYQVFPGVVCYAMTIFIFATYGKIGKLSTGVAFFVWLALMLCSGVVEMLTLALGKITVAALKPAPVREKTPEDRFLDRALSRLGPVPEADQIRATRITRRRMEAGLLRR